MALAEAYRVLKTGGRFLCLEFSACRRAAARPPLRLPFLRGHPARWASSSPATPSPTAIWSKRSASSPGQERSPHDPQARLPPRRATRNLTGGIAAIHSAGNTDAWRIPCSQPAISSASRAAGYILAREGVVQHRRPTICCRPAAAPWCGSPASSSGDRPGRERGARARARAEPARALLCEARPVSGDASRRRRRGCRRRARPAAGRDRAIRRRRKAVVIGAKSRQADRRDLRQFRRPVAAASIAQVHKATAIYADGKRRQVAVKVLRPAFEGQFPRDLSTLYAVARLVERWSSRWPAPAHDRGRRYARPLGLAGDGPPPRGGGALGIRRERRATTPTSACRMSTGTAPRARC